MNFNKCDCEEECEHEPQYLADICDEYAANGGMIMGNFTISETVYDVSLINDLIEQVEALSGFELILVEGKSVHSGTVTADGLTFVLCFTA